MSYYQHHVFFCCNQRDNGKASCEDHGANEMREYAKGRIRALGIAGENMARIQQTSCLDRCELGPVMVVYPEETWYTYAAKSDVDEIIDEHLQHGRIVERLVL